MWGSDLSAYQSGITQASINQMDVAIIKVTEGNAWVSPVYQSQFNMALSAGKKIGVYHFARPGDAVQQAEYFVQQTQAVGTPDFYALDWEDATLVSNENWAKIFMDKVKELTGLPVWFYCNSTSLLNYQYSSIGDGGYPLWLAWPYYTSADGYGGLSMSLDDVWNKFQITGWVRGAWQYTFFGNLSTYSGDLDMNLFDDSAPGLGGDHSTNVQAAAATPASTGTTTILPVTGFEVGQGFGVGADLKVDGVKTNVGGGHTGLDFLCPIGTSTVALESGTVLWADWGYNLPTDKGWEGRWYLGGGNYMGLQIDPGIVVVIQHPGYISTYSHLSETDLNIGDSVVQGQEVGKTGATGFVSGAHLHFEVIPTPTTYETRTDASIIFGRVNPVPYFTQTIETAGKDWFDMATKEDLKQAIREVRDEQINREGGVGGKTSIRAEIAWLTSNQKKVEEKLKDIAKAVYLLSSVFRVGLPGVANDGVKGGKVRKDLGYMENSKDPKSDSEQRLANYKKAEAAGFPSWAK